MFLLRGMVPTCLRAFPTSAVIFLVRRVAVVGRWVLGVCSGGAPVVGVGDLGLGDLGFGGWDGGGGGRLLLFTRVCAVLDLRLSRLSLHAVALRHGRLAIVSLLVPWVGCGDGRSLWLCRCTSS